MLSAALTRFLHVPALTAQHRRRWNPFCHVHLPFSLLSTYASLFSIFRREACACVWLSIKVASRADYKVSTFPPEGPCGSVSYQKSQHCPGSSLSLHLIIQTVWDYTALPHRVLVINYFSYLPKSVPITCKQLKHGCTASLYLCLVCVAAQGGQSIFSCST